MTHYILHTHMLLMSMSFLIPSAKNMFACSFVVPYIIMIIEKHQLDADFTYICSLHVSGEISPIIRSYRTVQIQIC